jgi:hypothetical protein
MWALFAALVVIPLLASRRSTAQPVVDAAYPPNATTGDTSGRPEPHDYAAGLKHAVPSCWYMATTGDDRR